MDVEKLIVKAFMAEAKRKPRERIIIGFRSYTYEEFASMLNHRREVDKQTKKTVEAFIKQAVKMFHDNEEFRSRIMSLAGESP